MKTFAIIALLGVATVSHALMIDDFSTGDINDKIFNLSNNMTYTGASVPGGNRWVYHEITSNPLSLSHSTIVINGVFASDNKTQVDSNTIIGYGSDAAGNFTAGTDLNLDLTGLDSFKINILSNDQPATLQIRLRTNSGALISSALHAITPGMVLTPQMVSINFSEFGGADFSDVDSIGIYLDSTASGDTVIDSFEAVPEPASMIALGLGVAALISRKRKA